MLLTRHQTKISARWALDGRYLPSDFRLALLLELPKSHLKAFLEALPRGEPAQGELLAPVEPEHEIWAAGVTYLRSREARTAESDLKDVYERVYEAARPELFFKSSGMRVRGHDTPIRIRKDGRWHVPEPELTLVINRDLEIVGHTLGNDVSSRDIEGENPLYLPQAKIFNGSCAIGPGIELDGVAELDRVTLGCRISRDNRVVFEGETSTSRIRRKFGDLADYLGRELEFPHGVFLMTGTGVVPPDDFTLAPDDEVEITGGALTLRNRVES